MEGSVVRREGRVVEVECKVLWTIIEALAERPPVATCAVALREPVSVACAMASACKCVRRRNVVANKRGRCDFEEGGAACGLSVSAGESANDGETFSLVVECRSDANVGRATFANDCCTLRQASERRCQGFGSVVRDEDEGPIVGGSDVLSHRPIGAAYRFHGFLVAILGDEHDVVDVLVADFRLGY